MAASAIAAGFAFSAGAGAETSPWPPAAASNAPVATPPIAAVPVPADEPSLTTAPTLSVPAPGINALGGGAVNLPAQDVIDETARIATIDLTAPTPDLWQRIRNGFGMPDLVDPLVTSRQAWYLNRPEYLRNTFARSRKYLYHIVTELEKRGMPTELALLPLVESSFNPQAQSPARALGMWQFIPSTGKNYKLEQSWWMDERRDIIASTDAALEYLQNIYEMNGDWHLALASYNWGEGAVARAMAKNAAKGLPTDYLSIRMPDETRNYVPKLQAVKNIIANPELFNFRLDPIPNEPYFATVEMDRNVDVSVAARLADIPISEFIALNPAYSRPVIPGSSDNPLVIPAEKLATFMANLRQHENADKPLSNWITYELKGKEKLDAVAARFGISGAKLRQLNGITRRTKVGPGLTLLVPGRNALQTDAVAAALPKTREPAEAKSSGKGRRATTRAPVVKNKAAAGKGNVKSASGSARKSAAPTTRATSKPVAAKPAGKASSKAVPKKTAAKKS